MRIDPNTSRLQKGVRAALSAEALDALFLAARTPRGWLEYPVSDETLHQLYDLLKMGPTSTNSCPGRFVFVRSKQAKELLAPALNKGNVERTMMAPVTVIVACDSKYHEYLPKLWPHDDAPRLRIVNDTAFGEEKAFRNSTLQGGYLMLAARALGLDCGPMSGFNNAKVDAAFFPDGRWKSNFLCNLGYGDDRKLHPRGPRLGFDEACRIE
ncbi:MAG TPA: malonic semialdehyde reductase [Acidobacteriaceae bacterium]|nr:malonic semialdehyde reductase [Acidobacteriaceae bacterium]